eukprot:GHVT01033722.1.p1 GENE.GHVT01033722.1~~GHVT01033722.1.p1  ORF type:complete len:170 (+),score=29.32 GHVT01033722.1:243-752(+)
MNSGKQKTKGLAEEEKGAKKWSVPTLVLHSHSVHSPASWALLIVPGSIGFYADSAAAVLPTRPRAGRQNSSVRRTPAVGTGAGSMGSRCGSAVGRGHQFRAPTRGQGYATHWAGGPVDPEAAIVLRSDSHPELADTRQTPNPPAALLDHVVLLLQLQPPMDKLNGLYRR